jgi:hypothetical protein
MLGTEIETSVIFSQLTRQVTPENLIDFSLRESFILNFYLRLGLTDCLFFRSAEPKA